MRLLLVEGARRGISQRMEKLMGALTRRIRRAPGRPQASAAAINRSKETSHLGGEDAGDRGGDHAPPGSGEKALTEPALQRGDLPAHRPICQAKLRRRLGIAASPSRNFEHAQSIQGREWAHRNRD
jgi:hypothetical protein